MSPDSVFFGPNQLSFISTFEPMILMSASAADIEPVADAAMFVEADLFIMDAAELPTISTDVTFEMSLESVEIVDAPSTESSELVDVGPVDVKPVVEGEMTDILIKPMLVDESFLNAESAIELISEDALTEPNESMDSSLEQVAAEEVPTDKSMVIRTVTEESAIPELLAEVTLTTAETSTADMPMVDELLMPENALPVSDTIALVDAPMMAFESLPLPESSEVLPLNVPTEEMTSEIFQTAVMPSDVMSVEMLPAESEPVVITDFSVIEEPLVLMNSELPTSDIAIPVMTMDAPPAEEASVVVDSTPSTTPVPVEIAPTIPATNNNDLIISSLPGDFIRGEGGHDILIGLGGDSYMKGDSGHDMLFVIRGNNVVDGGIGNDTAVFWGAKRSEMTFIDRGFGITEVVQGDVVNYLTNVEDVRFDDGDFKLKDLIIPAAETPVIETPVIEPPVIETPVIETPVIETPVIETPVIETPVIETPVIETPVIETPVIETPVVELPDADIVMDELPPVEILPMPIVETTVDQAMTEPPAEVPVADVPVSGIVDQPAVIVETPVITDISIEGTPPQPEVLTPPEPTAPSVDQTVVVDTVGPDVAAIPVELTQAEIDMLNSTANAADSSTPETDAIDVIDLEVIELPDPVTSPVEAPFLM